MGCCAGKGRNTFNRSYTTKRGVTTLVTTEALTKNGCKYSKKFLAELFQKFRKSGLEDNLKKSIQKEIALMSQKAHKVCPDELKIQELEKLLNPDESDSNI